MPRPTRRLACLEPSAGLIVLSSIVLSSCVPCLEHLHQIGDLVDHAAHCGRVFQGALAVQPTQTQADHGGTVRGTAADGATHQLDRHGFLVRHVVLRDQLKISSTVLPRLAATEAGVVERFRASNVARTML
eukprot:m.12581 g.12581  ORF g.12581 m.12581 type:complete len:131 (+) comp17568_c0_seq1:1694-2086(+)